MCERKRSLHRRTAVVRQERCFLTSVQPESLTSVRSSDAGIKKNNCKISVLLLPTVRRSAEHATAGSVAVAARAFLLIRVCLDF